jgi:hypothetical protein
VEQDIYASFEKGMGAGGGNSIALAPTPRSGMMLEQWNDPLMSSNGMGRHGIQAQSFAVERDTALEGIAHCTPCTIPYTRYTIDCTPCTMHHNLYAIHHRLYTMHHAPCTVHHAPCTVHCTPCTMHCTLYLYTNSTPPC